MSLFCSMFYWFCYNHEPVETWFLKVKNFTCWLCNDYLDLYTDFIWIFKASWYLPQKIFQIIVSWIFVNLGEDEIKMKVFYIFDFNTNVSCRSSIWWCSILSWRMLSLLLIDVWLVWSQNWWPVSPQGQLIVAT